MTDTPTRIYRFVEGHRTKWTLQLFNFYPEVGPKGTPGRGPYCYNWIRVKAKDRKRAERELATARIIPVPKGAIS